MGASKNPYLRASAAQIACLPHFIPTDRTTSHSTKPPKNGGQVAGYAALLIKLSCGQPEGYPSLKQYFLAYISLNMRRGEMGQAGNPRNGCSQIFFAPCIWANSEFLEVPKC
jgi:hypothetical protein